MTPTSPQPPVICGMNTGMHSKKNYNQSFVIDDTKGVFSVFGCRGPGKHCDLNVDLCHRNCHCKPNVQHQGHPTALQLHPTVSLMDEFPFSLLTFFLQGPQRLPAVFHWHCRHLPKLQFSGRLDASRAKLQHLFPPRGRWALKVGRDCRDRSFGVCLLEHFWDQTDTHITWHGTSEEINVWHVNKECAIFLQSTKKFLRLFLSIFLIMYMLLSSVTSFEPPVQCNSEPWRWSNLYQHLLNKSTLILPNVS